MKPYWSNNIVDLFQGDARDMNFIPDESVDCVISDPPYNVGKDFGEGKQADQKGNYLEWLWEVWRECGRVTRDGSFLIYTNRIRHLEFAFSPPPPWRYFYIGVWHKPLSLASTFYAVAPHWEPIIVWAKGKPWRPFRNEDVFSDVFPANVVAGAKRDGLRLHPTIKPEELLVRLIQFGCPPDGLILDPFIGSGTTAVVAQKLGRRCIGVDLNEDYLKLAVKRLEGVPLPLPLG